MSTIAPFQSRQTPIPGDATLIQIPELLNTLSAPHATPLSQSKVSAGFPSPADDFKEDSLDLNEYMIAHRAATFMFTVKGDSMQGAGILDGDKLVVDRSVDPLHTHIVIAVVNTDFTVKRLHKYKGKIELQAENPAFAPITLKDTDELIIWGVVTGVIRKLRL